MKKLLGITILTISVNLILTQISFGVCMLDGTTADGGNIINCPAPIQDTPLNPGSDPETTDQADEINIPAGGGINVTADVAIQSTRGDDIITISGDLTSVERNVIFTSDGDDTVIVNGGRVTNLFDANAIFTSDDNDTVIINGGVVSGSNRAIFTSGGDDTVIVNAGTLKSNEFSVMFLSSGNDIVNLNGGTYIKGSGTPYAVQLHTGDDVLTFGGDINLGGIVDCGEGFDTLVFDMHVSPNELPIISSEIESKDPMDGSITINGVFYEWENCELLQGEFRGIRSIPTLTEWGLIAMAGILGMTGFMALRKRVWNIRAN